MRRGSARSLLAPILIAGSALAAAPSRSPAGEIEIRRIFGTDAPGRYKHPSSITELANGDLYLVYHGGEGEYAEDTAVYGSRLAKGSERWDAPRAVADTPFRGEGNAVVWQSPEGPVWLFYVTRYGDTWSTSRIKAKISRDGARSWSDPFLLAFDQGLMVRCRPIVLDDGDYLLPIYHETGSDTELVPPDSTSLFLRCRPPDGRWSRAGRIRSRLGNIQPAVVELSPGHLICYARRGGDYEPRDDGYIVRSESRDGGETWSPGADSAFPNPNAAVDFLELENGHLLLIYNDSTSERTPLVAAISTDRDRSYPHRRTIIGGPGSYAYPYAVETRDGKIRVVFTSDERTVIREAVFEESAVLGHGAKE